ncbi:MAG: site-specific integrase [Terriglobales bacterium]
MKRDGLYKRNKNIFAFRYQDKDGIWCEKSTGETDREQAKKFKTDFLKDVEQDTLPTSKAKWTVEQACTRWVEQHAVHLKSAKARKNEQSYLRQLLRHLGETKNKKLKAITLDDLRDYQTRRSEKVRERPINLELGILVRVLKQNHLWKGELRGVPEDKESGFKRLREPDSEVGEALTEDQLMRLESAARSRDRWDVAYCAELLAANSGMRGGEIKKLQIGKVDLVGRSILITRKATKSRAGRRQVELNQPAFAAVARLYKRAQVLGACDPEHYLLPGDLSRHTRKTDPLKGGRGFNPALHQMSWDTAWRALRKAAGLPRLRFHNLRHTYVTRMAELGVPLQVTQSAVGHLSDAITAHYTHVSANVARAAVEKLEQIRKTPHFVDVFVDERRSAVESKPKLLN